MQPYVWCWFTVCKRRFQYGTRSETEFVLTETSRTLLKNAFGFARFLRSSSLLCSVVVGFSLRRVGPIHKENCDINQAVRNRATRNCDFAGAAVWIKNMTLRWVEHESFWKLNLSQVPLKIEVLLEIERTEPALHHVDRFTPSGAVIGAVSNRKLVLPHETRCGDYFVVRTPAATDLWSAKAEPRDVLQEEAK